MEATRAASASPRKPLSSLSSNQQQTEAPNVQTTTFLGELYKMTTSSVSSFLRQPFGASSTATRVFAPDPIAIPAKPAWQREKRQGVNRKGKKVTVWKRYETRANASKGEDKENDPTNAWEEPAAPAIFPSPKKVLKKVCMTGPNGHSTASPAKTRRRAVAASYDRRRSVLPHKLRVLRVDHTSPQVDENDVIIEAPTLMKSESTQGLVEESNEEVVEDLDDQTEDPPATGLEDIPTSENMSEDGDTDSVMSQEHIIPILSAAEAVAAHPVLFANGQDPQSAESASLEMDEIKSSAESVETSEQPFRSEASSVIDIVLEDDSAHVLPNESKNVLNLTESDAFAIDQTTEVDPIDLLQLRSPVKVAQNFHDDSLLSASSNEPSLGPNSVTNEHGQGNGQINEQNVEGPVDVDDDGECLDFTSCFEDPTVVGDQYVGTLELKGLRLPSRAEMSGDETSGVDEDTTNVMVDDPELFDFLDEKAARPLQAHQSPTRSPPRKPGNVPRDWSPGPASPSELVTLEETTTVNVDFNDEDENILTDFISRAKASKAARIAKRTSDGHKRDSGVIKQALASPRKPDDEKAAESPPTPVREEQAPQDAERSEPADQDKSPAEEMGEVDELVNAIESVLPERRSTRRTGADYRRDGPSAPSSVALRRPGAVVLRRTELQELANQTRINTRRNKASAISAKEMLARLKAMPPQGNFDDSTQALEQRRTVRWNEDLVSFYDESNKKRDIAQVPDAEEPAREGKSRSRRTNSATTNPQTLSKSIESSDAQSEKETAQDNTVTKIEEPARKVVRRRQIPKPTMHRVTRTAAAATRNDEESLHSPDEVGHALETTGAVARAPVTRKSAAARSRAMKR